MMVTSKPAFRSPRTVDEFVEAAATAMPPARKTLPGEPPTAKTKPKPAEPVIPPTPELNPRIMKQVNFDLSEPDHYRLKEVVSSMSGRMSLRKFIVAAIQAEIARVEKEQGRGG